MCLQEIGESIGCEVVCFDNDSEFYRLHTRNGSLKRLAAEAINQLEGDVFTHNEWGEYGHIDHILCHVIATQSGLPVHTTDITQEVNWLPIRQRTSSSIRHSMTWEAFAHLKSFYEARGCWTWSADPVLECGVYRVC